MVQSVNIDVLGSELGVLFLRITQLATALACSWVRSMSTHDSVHHFQNLSLHKLEILGIASRSTADDVVNSIVIILTAHTTYKMVSTRLNPKLPGGEEGGGVCLYSPRSIALENLTKTECFFMIRWMCCPPMPMIRLWY